MRSIHYIHKSKRRRLCHLIEDGALTSIWTEPRDGGPVDVMQGAVPDDSDRLPRKRHRSAASLLHAADADRCASKVTDDLIVGVTLTFRPSGPPENRWHVMCPAYGEVYAGNDHAAAIVEAEAPCIYCSGDHSVERHEDDPDHYELDVHMAGNWGHGRCFPNPNDPDQQGITLAEARRLAEAELDRMQEQVGVVSQHMMASTSYRYIVVRPVEGGRWVATIGLGGHTIAVPGSVPTAEDAEALGREAIRHHWAQDIEAYRRTAGQHGIPLRVLATQPEVKVIHPPQRVCGWNHIRNTATA